jgi:glycosyltransferase involved in cell wall biosynthesis
MRILTFGTLYPDSTRPHHGVFVEQRLRHLLELGGVEARVVAPVPWFPSRSPLFGRWAALASVPHRETRHGIDVLHPRYPSVPKIGALAAPFLMAAALTPVLRKLIRDGYDFDLIDAHYFFPDGVAAVLLGHRLGKPVAITARGTDLTLIATHALPRRMIRWAAHSAACLVTVCQALKDVLVRMDIAPERVTVLRNGVDLGLFRPPVDRAAVRARLSLTRPTLLSVGRLIPLKGHALVVRALVDLPDFDYRIAGTGPEEGRLRQLVAGLGLEDRVRLLGAVPHEELRDWYGAADALLLPSSREGWANVLLESMACGTPVVATDVWGIPEVVTAPEAGRLVAERTPAALAEGVRALFASRPDRAATRRYAERFSWDETCRSLRALLGSAVRAADAAAS